MQLNSKDDARQSGLGVPMQSSRERKVIDESRVSRASRDQASPGTPPRSDRLMQLNIKDDARQSGPGVPMQSSQERKSVK